MQDYTKYGYTEVGRLNLENYYSCDECGTDEFAFDENMISQGYNRIFLNNKKYICETCLQMKIENLT